MNKALFLDRDGVINVDYGYVHKAEDCRFLPGIFDLVKAAKEKEYLVIIVTNQAGIGRGYYTEDVFTAFMDWMNEKFNYAFDAIYFCPDHPQYGLGPYKRDSYDRKPNPGMLLKAIKEHNLQAKESMIIGDKESDMVAGYKADIGLRFLLSESDTSLPCQPIQSLHEVMNWL